MEWMLLPPMRYADFAGRSSRREYWMFTLGYLILFAICAFIFRPLMWIAVLALLVPSLAVQVRRFHDRDMSGLWVLLAFIPLGTIVVFILMCLPGTVGPNRFGEDPLNPDTLGEVFA